MSDSSVGTISSFDMQAARDEHYPTHLQGNKSHSAWYGILYILLFLSLFMTVISITQIVHVGIDKLIPDSRTSILSSISSSNYGLNFAISILLVSLPISAILMIWLRIKTLKTPQIKQSIIRMFLMYVGMILAFLTIIWALVTSVNGFLDGVMTTRLMVHSGANLVIAGITLTYLAIDVYRERV